MFGWASAHACATFLWYELHLAAKAALTIASAEAAAFLAAFLLDGFAALKAPDTLKSTAVGRSADSPGSGLGGKTSASAGLDAVPKSRPLASPLKYFPWEARPAGDISHRRNSVASLSCLAIRPHPDGQTVVACMPLLS